MLPTFPNADPSRPWASASPTCIHHDQQQQQHALTATHIQTHTQPNAVQRNTNQKASTKPTAAALQTSFSVVVRCQCDTHQPRTGELKLPCS